MRRIFIDEPYLWLQSCFFQPVKFRQELETRVVSQRLMMLLRLTPLLFLYAYTPALVTRIIIYSLHPDFYPIYAVGRLVPLSISTAWFLFDATWATAVSCLIAALFCGLFSIRLGIAAALALGLANGIIVNTDNDTLVGIVFGIAFGLLLGIAFNSANEIRHGRIENVTAASMIGIVAGLLIGGFTGTIGAYWVGFLVGTLYPQLQNELNIWGSTAGLIVGGICGCLLAFLFGILVRRLIKRDDAVVAVGIRVALAVAVAFGVALGIPVGDAGVSYATPQQGIVVAAIQMAIVGSGFLPCYLLSYYRLPLYPISAYSTIQAYLFSQRQKQHVLYALRNSALHWDECVFLPLPYLKGMLLLIAEQTLTEALTEMNFIVHERPQQLGAAQATAYELALLDLRNRVTLRDISLAQQQLALLLPHPIRESDLRIASVFRVLNDASAEAASYIAQSNKRDRQQALARMQDDLKSLRNGSAFGNHELNQLLKEVINQWSLLAAQGHETLGSVSGNLSIENPYAPGNPLGLRDPLFVGRDDVTQKLGQALQKKYRPTFLLTGERRMGKSSIIKQLPVLLGPRYIPVFYDLQTPGILASIAAFLAAVAAGIERQCSERGLLLHHLERSELDAAQQHSEVAVYDQFEQWLAEVERILTQAERSVILAFDEFEKLEDAEERGSINLKLLFDLFRSIMQNRSRLALLFSGAKMVGDMGRSWAGYFVNVERIKVSFLHPVDAYALITRPVPGIFNEEVTREIVRITRCHPFLIQAVCKQVIELLNASSRKLATLADVELAAQEVFDNWAVYFYDLWDRCDDDQRRCSLALLALREADVDRIAQQSNLEKNKAFIALEKLQLRDIVVREQVYYQLAVPLFASWIKQILPPASSVNE